MLSACVAFPQQFCGLGAAERQLEPEKAAAGEMPEHALCESTFP
jgi:hypothetical protein